MWNQDLLTFVSVIIIQNCLYLLINVFWWCILFFLLYKINLLSSIDIFVIFDEIRISHGLCTLLFRGYYFYWMTLKYPHILNCKKIYIFRVCVWGALNLNWLMYSQNTSICRETHGQHTLNFIIYRVQVDHIPTHNPSSINVHLTHTLHKKEKKNNVSFPISYTPACLFIFPLLHFFPSIHFYQSIVFEYFFIHTQL